MKQTNKTEGGFSAVELLLTLFIAAAFVGSFYQLYTSIAQTNASARLRAVASDVAYSNLRKYTSKPSFTCNTTTDLTVDANAAGQVLSQTTDTNSTLLTNPYIQTIRVYAPRGCGSSLPALVVSTVEYGTPSQKVTHATYVN